MLKAGIALITLAVIALPVAFGAALFGFGEVASVAFEAAKLLSPLMLVVGILLVSIAANRRGDRAVA
jgi:uncharacterized membrane protein YtjA (UPF0391 family)